MKAIATADFGVSPSIHEIPTPAPGPDEVLVRVQSSSLNGIDLAVAGGYLKGMMEHRFPVVLGRDFAGTVAAIGTDVTRFKIGDDVMGVVMKPFLGDGAFAEYLRVPEGVGITNRDHAIPVAEAGAIGLAGAAAYDSVQALNLKKGETVLISGATGGVGAFAIQLAVARGASVIATARPGTEADFVRSLGASYVVDYTADIAKAVKALRPNGVEAALHFAGKAQDLMDVLAPKGRIASTLGIRQDAATPHGIVITSIMANPSVATLDALAAEVAAGRLKVKTHRTYKLGEVPSAIHDFSTGTLGKLVILVDTGV